MKMFHYFKSCLRQVICHNYCGLGLISSVLMYVKPNLVIFLQFFTPRPLRAICVLFSPMVSGWAGGQGEKVCLGCISETVRCRKFILGRDSVGVQCHGLTLI